MIRMQIGVNSQLYLGTIFYKSIPPEVFIEKGILKICRKFTGEHLRQSVISKLESIFIGITLRHGCTPINLLHISDHLFTEHRRTTAFNFNNCTFKPLLKTSSLAKNSSFRRREISPVSGCF